MGFKKALVYLLHAGINVTTICAICNLNSVPISSILERWEMGHKVSDKYAGRDKIENLFPVHSTCNGDQHMRSLAEIRGAAGYTTAPFPHALASIEDARNARRDILSGM